jgi:hypothetical protein
MVVMHFLSLKAEMVYLRPYTGFLRTRASLRDYFDDILSVF